MEPIWIAYDEMGAIWGTGATADYAKHDAVNHIDHNHDTWFGSIPNMMTAPATLAVIAVIGSIGGDPDEWARYNVSWAIQDGVARLTSQG